MALYTYRCSECGLDFEQYQSIKDLPGATCPKCGKVTAHRLINIPYFILKGDGWPGKEIDKHEN